MDWDLLLEKKALRYIAALVITHLAFFLLLGTELFDYSVYAENLSIGTVVTIQCVTVYASVDLWLQNYKLTLVMFKRHKADESTIDDIAKPQYSVWLTVSVLFALIQFIIFDFYNALPRTNTLEYFIFFVRYGAIFSASRGVSAYANKAYFKDYAPKDPV